MGISDFVEAPAEMERKGFAEAEFCFFWNHVGQNCFLNSQTNVWTTRIVLVMDNLNTYKKASLYEAFEPVEAKRIADKLEIHYSDWVGTLKFMAISNKHKHGTVHRHIGIIHACILISL